VNNLTEITKMPDFVSFVILLVTFFDEMNASVHERKCYDLVFAERKMMGSCHIQCNQKSPPLPRK